MADLVRKEKHFFVCVRHAGRTRVLRKELFQNITDDQARALTQIGINSLYGILPNSRNSRIQLTKIKSFIQRLTDASMSAEERKELIASNSESAFKLVDATFEAVEQYIWRHVK